MNTRLLKLCWKQLKLGHCNRKVELFSLCNQTFIASKQMFKALWSKSVLVYTLRTGARLQYQTFCILLSSTAPKFPFWGIFCYIKHLPIICLLMGFKSVHCLSYRVVSACVIESVVTVKWLKNTRCLFKTVEFTDVLPCSLLS